MEKKQMRAALVGNPNTGKTTLFNALTGGRLPVGNRPGVTVEAKTGIVRTADTVLEITDLPGLYALSADAPEEKATREALLSGGFDVILSVADATKPERSLYLTVQLLALGIPCVVAMNFWDMAERQHKRPDCAALQARFGVPFVPVSAGRGENLPALLKAAVHAGAHDPAPFQALKTAQARYDFLAGAQLSGGEEMRSRRIDRVVTSRLLALPCFLLVLFCVFAVTFGPPGRVLSALAERLISDGLVPGADAVLQAIRVAPWLRALLCEGVLGGVGTVVAFLPQLTLLFLLFGVLEDSGYLARTAYILDAPLRRVGLSGHAAVPLLLGFGCTVPAVMSTRVLERTAERRRAVFLLPFFSCSAKMPVYAMLASAFFAEKAPLIILSLYAIGLAAALLTAFLFPAQEERERMPFVLELPPYRRPTAKSLSLYVRAHVASFLKKAGSVLLLTGIAVWALSYFTPHFTVAAEGEASLLDGIGHILSPLLALCGFSDPRAAAALLAGLGAKEAVLTTLSVTGGAAGVFLPLSAYSFLLFVLLYTPCAAALATVRRELGARSAALAALWPLFLAWLLSALFFQAGTLLLRLL